MTDKPSILIVDDTPEIVWSIVRTLRDGGYDLTPLTDPREAIERLSKQRFDVLLCDIEMPEVNGHDVMRAARTLQPKTVRIFVTGAAKMEYAISAINDGEVFRFVRKPFEVDELRQIVKEALERKAELDMVAEATSRHRDRRELYEQLEAEHPGVTRVELDSGGCYVVDSERVGAAAKELGLDSFLEP